MSGLEETAASRAASRLSAALKVATAAATAATAAVTAAALGQPPPPGKIYKFCFNILILKKPVNLSCIIPVDLFLQTWPRFYDLLGQVIV